ncbi:hypothetical protein Tco_0787207 [Tanacetum coccineum]
MLGLLAKHACQTCLSAEVRIRLEHVLRGKKRLDGRCSMQEKLLKEKDVEIADLKARLSLKEAEAAEATCLRGQVADVEAAGAAWACELESLKEQNVALESAAVAKDVEIAKLSQDLSQLQLSCDDLSIKASTFECDKDKLIDQVSALEATCSRLREEVSGYQLFKEQIEEMQDTQVKSLSDRVTGMDSDLMALALHMDEEFYPCYLTTLARRRWILSRGVRLVIMKCLQSFEYMITLGRAIGCAIEKGMQDGLVAGIDHGKAGRVLTDVSAYNPSAKANYLAAINDLRSVEGFATKTLKGLLLQPSPEQLMGDATACCLSLTDAMVPLVEPLSVRSLTGEVSTSGVPTVTTALSTTFSQANTILLAPSFDVPPSPRIVSEQENLNVTPKHAPAVPPSAAYLALERCLHFMYIAFLKVADVPCLWQDVPAAVSELVRSLA